MSPRYVVGIDLGTTNCAMAWADLQADERAAPQMVPVPQLVARGALEARTLLPSFLYIAHESEGPQSLPSDPKRPFAVGEYARSRGADSPARLVASAKSWLSHGGVDRRATILPQAAPDDVEKISPVEASWRYLEHLSEAWDAAMARQDRALALSQQEVVLTGPASFDASARELTVEAAVAAGLEHLTLLEEPQAALYAWIQNMGSDWRKQIRVGDVILVVDVGGGTTDFSAIAARQSGGALELERIAVGDHILLGGDNMDLALAHGVRDKLSEQARQLDKWQMLSLTHACRAAKETLLSDDAIAAAPIALAARGSQLLGSTVRTQLVREQLDRILLDGFFPEVASQARPVMRARTALTQFGLPYAADAAITRHLAAFLSRQVHANAPPQAADVQGAAQEFRRRSLLHPTAVLFNGGVMKSALLRERLVRIVNEWLLGDGGEPVRVLTGNDLDLAVARGAAAYGLVRHGHGIRIHGGTARSYYIGIESPAPAVPGVEPPLIALCVAPFGLDEGTAAQLPPHQFGLVVGETVRFRFFGSSVRRHDGPGDQLEDWSSDELQELPPIEVSLPASGRPEGEVVAVHLCSTVTEVGTLRIEAIPEEPRTANERWEVELSVRSEQ